MIIRDATISVVSCNLALAERCVKAVRFSGAPVALILTANGSPEVTEYFRIATDLNPLDLAILNTVNRGFIRPNRMALSVCKTPIFITLNDDVVIREPDWLAKMLAPFEDERVAGVGVQGFPCQLATPGVFRGSPGPRVDYAEMSCAAFRADALREVDAFPEWLDFAYGEDVHAGIALTRAGYRLAQVPVDVIHEGGVTAATIPNLQEFKNRNHAALMQRYGDFWNQHVQQLAHP